MTKSPLKFLLPVLTCFLLASCGEDVETRMKLNGKEFTSSADRPSLDQKDAYYEVFVAGAAKVVAADQSIPGTAVTSRRWLVKDPSGAVVIDKEDIGGFEFECKLPGWYSVYLEVNEQEEDAQTCWVYARAAGSSKPAVSVTKPFEVMAPIGKDIKTKDRNIELKMRTELWDESALDGITVMFNGKRVNDLALDLDKALTTAQLNLKKGENTIEIMAEIGGEVFEEKLNILRMVDEPVKQNNKTANNSKDKIEKVEIVNPKNKDDGGMGKTTVDKEEPVKPTPPVKPTTPAFGENLEQAKAAYSSELVTNACLNDLVDNYSFTITPTRRVRIDDFIIFNTVCGAVEVLISSSQGELLRTTETLTAGKSQISFGLYSDEVFLKKGVKYTFSLKPEEGNANCGSSEMPKLVDTSACSPELQKEAHFKTNYRGKSIIHDITYSY
jgi:hypothetical protein